MNSIYTNSPLIGPSIGSRWAFNTLNPFKSFTVQILDVKNSHVLYRFVEIAGKEIQNGSEDSSSILSFYRLYNHIDSDQAKANAMGLSLEDYQTYDEDMEKLYQESYKDEVPEPEEAPQWLAASSLSRSFCSQSGQ